MQLTHTLGLLSVLASKEEHTSTGKEDSPRGLHGRGSHHPSSWKPTQDDVKICFCHSVMVNLLIMHGSLTPSRDGSIPH